MIPQATADLYRVNRLRYALLLRAILAEWARLTPSNDWDAAWRVAGPRITGLVTAAQAGAAADGARSVGLAFAELGVDEVPLATVVPAAFAGVASDGRPLDSLMRQSVATARAAGSAEEGLAAGSRWLAIATKLQLNDAARQATATTIVATPGAGWVRYVSPPCCQDCAVQAGKWFRWNQGFLRHPNCDCVHRPAHSSEQPASYTETVPIDQIHDLTEAQRMALEDGADISQVVNAYRRAARDKSGRVAEGARERMGFTTEGTTPRGWASYVARADGRSGPRPTPELIYRNARTRQEAVDLLHRFGYVVGPNVPIAGR